MVAVLLLATVGTVGSLMETDQMPPVYTEEVEVAATRLPQETSTARRSLVLTRREIAALPASTIPDLLSAVAGTGLSRRGAFGVQADGALRGTTFEQVAVVVDGIRLNDPQTGHFHLSLPLPLDAIERIEIVAGPGSAVYGPDAFGGVVAITTGPPPAATAGVVAGDYGLFGGRASVPLGAGVWTSVESARHGGYRPGTEARIRRSAVGWGGKTRTGWRWQVTGGADAARFGAKGFYSMTFPDQWEATEGVLMTATLRRSFPGGEAVLRAGGRQHRDHFLLDRNRPDWYRNRHRSRSGVVQAAINGGRGQLTWTAGTEGELQSLQSTRLGEHHRNRAAVFGEAAWNAGRWVVHGQLRGDHMTGAGWQVSPAAGVQLTPAPGWQLALHRGRSFRQPSFTELHYESPASRGDPTLQPEQAWTDEVLLGHRFGSWRWEFAAFQRHSRDLIDWVRQGDGTDRATNFARSRTRGMEGSLILKGSGVVQHLRAGVAWLNPRLDVDATRSRYALTHPRWEAAISGDATLGTAVRAAWLWRWRQPQRAGSFATLDLRFTMPVARRLDLILEVTNVFNRSYQEIPGVPRPGRWATLGMNWRNDAP